MEAKFFGFDVNYLIVVGLAIIGACTVLSIIVNDFLNYFKESKGKHSIDEEREKAVASEMNLEIEQFEMNCLIDNRYEVITREKDYTVLFKKGSSSIVRIQETFTVEGD